MASTNNNSNLQEALTTRLKRYCGLDCLSSDNNMDTDNQDNDNNNHNKNNGNEDNINNSNNKDNNADVGELLFHGEDETTQEKPKISDRMLSWVATGIRKKARRIQPETPPPQSELEWLYNAGTTGEKDFLTQESLSSPMKRSIDNVEEPEQEPLPKFTRRLGGSIERSPRQANTNTRFASSRFQSTNLSADEAKLPATKSPLVARNLRFKGLKRKRQGTKLKEPPIDTATAEKNSQRLKEAKLKLKETKSGLALVGASLNYWALTTRQWFRGGQWRLSRIFVEEMIVKRDS